jgi:3',5'-cyclic AMP phosphodiesterase CpdA
MVNLVRGRARKFRLERLESVFAHVQSLKPDHILITGDLTTTALPREFADARAALAPILADRNFVTILPGNHDRYTRASHRRQSFEKVFGEFMPRATFPWIRWLDERTAILGLDPTRPHLTARGKLPIDQLEDAKRLLNDQSPRPQRLIVACHYPIVAPPVYQHELAEKKLINDWQVRDWLSALKPHVYCCGHVHAAWAHTRHDWPDHLSLNSGAPLLRDRTGLRSPGFLEITLHDADISVQHHAWHNDSWTEKTLYQNPLFFELTDGDNSKPK